jgi:hypothetical protein
MKAEIHRGNEYIPKPFQTQPTNKLNIPVSVSQEQSIIYVEFRKWRLYWGLNIDSETEINNLLNDYQYKGYECIQYVPNMGFFPNLPLFKLIIVFMASILTLGFVSYYVGPSFIFKKVPITNIEKVPESIQASNKDEKRESRPSQLSSSAS